MHNNALSTGGSDTALLVTTVTAGPSLHVIFDKGQTHGSTCNAMHAHNIVVSTVSSGAHLDKGYMPGCMHQAVLPFQSILMSCELELQALLLTDVVPLDQHSRA